MGRRTSKFRCVDCGAESWEVFEHYNKSELIEFLQDLSCSECDSSNCELTEVSEFAGGSEQPRYPSGDRYRHFRCNGCFNDFWVHLPETTTTEIQEIIDTIQCDRCHESSDFKLTDGYHYVPEFDEKPLYINTANQVEEQ